LTSVTINPRTPMAVSASRTSSSLNGLIAAMMYFTQGGSTITQQVAKLLCLGVPWDPEQWESEAAYEAECRRGTIWRKLQEVPFAWRWSGNTPRTRSSRSTSTAPIWAPARAASRPRRSAISASPRTR
jgi:hypothetical protein